MLCHLVGKKVFSTLTFLKISPSNSHNSIVFFLLVGGKQDLEKKRKKLQQTTNSRCCISRVDSGSILRNNWEWQTKTKRYPTSAHRFPSGLPVYQLTTLGDCCHIWFMKHSPLNTSLLITVSTISGHHFAPYVTFTPLRVKSMPLARWTRNPFNMEKSRY